MFSGWISVLFSCTISPLLSISVEEETFVCWHPLWPMSHCLCVDCITCFVSDIPMHCDLNTQLLFWSAKIMFTELLLSAAWLNYGNSSTWKKIVVIQPDISAVCWKNCHPRISWYRDSKVEMSIWRSPSGPRLLAGPLYQLEGAQKWKTPKSSKNAGFLKNNWGVLPTLPHGHYIHAWLQASGMSFSCRCGHFGIWWSWKYCAPNSLELE